MDKEQIYNLLKVQGYPVFMLEKTYAKIEKFQPEIAKAFEQWVNTGAYPELTIEGYTFTYLVNNMNMKPVGAFITLDWLIREPEEAKKALRQGIK